MSYQLEYHLLFPITLKGFDETELTFSINRIRSRKPSVAYFKLHCYDTTVDENGVPTNEIYTYTSTERWVIGTVYDHVEHTFELSSNVVANTAYTQLELITLGIDSENPLYFTEVMFQEKTFDEYHKPSDVIEDISIKFVNNNYVNLYDKDGNSLQVLRLNKEPFSTTKLNKAQVTVLAPHLDDEDEDDNHVNIFFEVMNQTEQTINVLR